MKNPDWLPCKMQIKETEEAAQSNQSAGASAHSTVIIQGIKTVLLKLLRDYLQKETFLKDFVGFFINFPLS